MLKEYNTDIQRLFLQMMVTNSELYTRVMNIMNPENFDRSLRNVAEFIVEHTAKYSIMPDITQIKATTGEAIDHIEDLSDGHYEWFLEEFESFTKRQELERAILKAADMLEKGEFDPVEQLIKDAVQISLQRDMGTDYFADPKERLNKYFNAGGQVSTGWPQLDRVMYGGMSRGELNIFAGGSGSGKSLFMQNIAINWVTQGLNGVFLSLELSEELCAMRMDSMVANVSTKEVFRDLDNVELKVKMAGKKSGSLRIKYMPAQSNVNQIRAYLKELEVQTGRTTDFIMVDYLDLVMPVSAKVSPNDLFVKDKYVSEELRNLAKELNVLFVTASQLNRSAVEEIEFDHSHISGGISKINTADNVFGIFTSRAMRERGKYQIQCMKSRSSTGVGMKIDLDYNIETMRITDPGEEAGPVNSFAKGNLLDSIKAKSTMINGTEPANPANREDSNKITADVQSAKLKQLLGQIKQS